METEYEMQHTREIIEIPANLITHNYIAGFQVSYENGIPYLTEDGIYTLAFIKTKFKLKKDMLSEIVSGNSLQLSASSRRGLTEEEVDSVKSELPYIKDVYEKATGITEKQGFQFRNNYKLTVRNGEQRGFLYSLFEEQKDLLKVIGARGSCPLVFINGKAMQILRDQKQKLSILSEDIMDLSEKVLKIYEEQIILTKNIKNGISHKKPTGGN